MKMDDIDWDGSPPAERAEMHRLLDEEIDAEEKAQSASTSGNAAKGA